jgi:hypothetical protein
MPGCFGRSRICCAQLQQSGAAAVPAVGWVVCCAAQPRLGCQVAHSVAQRSSSTYQAVCVCAVVCWELSSPSWLSSCGCSDRQCMCGQTLPLCNKTYYESCVL